MQSVMSSLAAVRDGQGEPAESGASSPVGSQETLGTAGHDVGESAADEEGTPAAPAPADRRAHREGAGE